jgi:serine phosphatase RsbU (regulator of sigma subunit)
MIAFAQAMFEAKRRSMRLDGEMSPMRAVAAIGNETSKKVQQLTEELDALRREQAKLQQAVFEAAQIQRRLCAPRELIWGEFEMAGEIFPVRHLSGDFFKVMELGPALGFAVGDIAGKGFTAGIWQAHLMSLVQQSARKHATPAAVVGEVNQELSGAADEPPLTALFFALVDRETNEVTYCNAGLPAPLLLRGNKVVKRLDVGGPMLGAVKGADFQTGRLNLDPGDMLVAYSDGVTECRNASDDEFDMERLTAAVTAVSGATATKALFSLLGTVLDFAGSCSPGDDMTLMVVRRSPQQVQAEADKQKRFFSSSTAVGSAGKPRVNRPRGRNSK